MITRIITIALIALTLTACGPGNRRGGNEVGGTLIGAAVGGLLGSQFGKGSGQLAMTALGVLAGAAIGNHIGQTMDAQDAAYTRNTLERTPTGQSVAWNNPDTGYQHRVTPTRTVMQGSGQPCREFTHTVMIGGQPKQAYGTACRQADGSWQIQ